MNIVDEKLIRQIVSLTCSTSIWKETKTEPQKFDCNKNMNIYSRHGTFVSIRQKFSDVFLGHEARGRTLGFLRELKVLDGIYGGEEDFKELLRIFIEVSEVAKVLSVRRGMKLWQFY
jgi:hypothetical protein